MELQFDKEIDVILRKARDGTGEAGAVAAADHIDADTIAAFAENALPDKARLLYTSHLADCDRCRKQLSQAIKLNNEAEFAAASPVSEPVVERAVPWYQTVLRTPNLALALGGLILVLGGVLGYFVIERQNESANSVSEVKEPEQTRSGPYFTDQQQAANTNANASAVANMATRAANQAANSTANSMTTAPPAPANNAPVIAGKVNPPEQKIQSENQLSDAAGSGTSMKPAAAAPPPTDMSAGERDEKRLETMSRKEAPKDALAKQKRSDDRGATTDALRPAAKSARPSVFGLDAASNTGASRTVGGKVFNNRNGAWYDSAYHGQATTNVHRATDEYKKLDSGLRNIANTLGGAVVMVWKSKAYRIQ